MAVSKVAASLCLLLAILAQAADTEAQTSSTGPNCSVHGRASEEPAAASDRFEALMSLRHNDALTEMWGRHVTQTAVGTTISPTEISQFEAALREALGVRDVPDWWHRRLKSGTVTERGVWAAPLEEWPQSSSHAITFRKDSWNSLEVSRSFSDRFNMALNADEVQRRLGRFGFGRVVALVVESGYVLTALDRGVGTPYAIAFHDGRSGEKKWEAVVCGGGIRVFASGWVAEDAHELSVSMAGDNALVVWGQVRGCLYVESFDIRTGDCLERFSTFVPADL